MAHDDELYEDSAGRGNAWGSEDAMSGRSLDPAMFETTPLDVGAINEALAGLGLSEAVSKADLPQPLAELVEAVAVSGDRRRLRRLIGDVRLDEPVRIDSPAAARTGTSTGSTASMAVSIDDSYHRETSRALEWVSPT